MKKKEYRINIFQQLNAFYSKVFSGDHEFTPHHISLYVFILNQNNRNNWAEWFKMPFDLAMAGACIGSKTTYYKCLKELSEWKYIEYEKGGNEWKAPKIKVVVLKCTANIPQCEIVEVQTEVQNSTAAHTATCTSTVPLPDTQVGRDNNSITDNSITGNNLTNNNLAAIAAERSPKVEEVPEQPASKVEPQKPKEEKKEKVPPKEKKPPTLHGRCREIFERVGKEKEKIVSWGSRYGGSLNVITYQIKLQIRQGTQHEVSDDEIVAGFEHIITHLPPFYMQKFDLNQIANNFDAIANEIKSGGKLPQNNKKSFLKEMAKQI